jgi:heme ABC exporter ATP-binding subunit CcmA
VTSSAVAAVSLHNVSKFFGRFAALRSVNAEFASGRLYAIVGENGAGKSTLLRIIAGLSRPSHGQVEFDSGDPRLQPGLIGYMGHGSMLYEELTALENLQYFARLYGTEPRNTNYCGEMLRLMGLDPESRRRVSEFSQGMRQRLSFARAILHQPRLLLLDEPFSNLDAEAIERISRALAELRQHRTTILLVTHHLSAAQDLADEIITMSAGMIVRPQHSPPLGEA